MEGTMQIYFVRHSETQWNALGRLQGESDVPLSEQGKKLADITGAALENVPFDIAYVSPYIRARQTAAHLLRRRQIPVFEDERIREITWGKWDGLTAKEIEKMGKKEEYQLFYTDPFRFQGAPDGETIRQVCQRGREFLDDLTGRKDLSENTVLVVTHGCAVRGILNHLYEDPKNFWQEGVPPNCAVTVVEAKGETLKIIEKDQIFYDPSQIRNHYVPEP